jgi:hypothetical protein
LTSPVFQVLINAGQQLVGISGSDIQCNDTLDTECKTKDQTNQYETHEAPVSINEILFQQLITLFSAVEEVGSSSTMGGGATSSAGAALALQQLHQ